MKVRCDIILDLDTGAYDFTLHNVSQPGQPMEYDDIRTLLLKMLEDIDEQNLRIVYGVSGGAC